MIVDSMTFEEVFEEFKKDIPLLNHRIEDNSKIYSRLSRNVINQAERIYYKPIEFSSPRGLNYTIQFFLRGKAENMGKSLGSFYYVTFVQKKKTYLFRPSLMAGMIWHFIFYPPHFFDRYKERILKDTTISSKEAINKYIMNNLQSISQKKTIPSKKHPNEYWAACNEGLCLCENPSGVFVQANTIIPWEMARIDQKRFVKEGMSSLSEYDFELNLPDEVFEDFDSNC